MTSPAQAPPAAGKGRRRWLLAALTGVVLAALAVGAYVWYRAVQPQPPAVDLAGADPAVVRAVEAARSAVRASPRSEQAWGHLGMVLLAYRFHAEAAVCFTRAEHLAPREPRWPYLHGVALQQDPEAALPHLERAAELCQGVPDAPALRLAETCLELGQLDAARRHFRQIVERQPSHPRAHLGLGRLACERGDWAKSLPHLRQAASSDLTRKAASLLLAEVRQRLGDGDEAARALARAAELPDDPSWPDPFLEQCTALNAGKEARLARVQQLRRQGRQAEAQTLAHQVEEEYPDVYWLVEGRVRLAEGNLTAAEAALRQAVALTPDSVEAQFDLATVLFRRQDPAGAATIFRRVTEREPDYGPAHLGLGRCLAAQGDRAAALRALAAAVRSMPQTGEAHRDLGELLAEDGQQAEAVVHLRHAIRLQPDDAKAKALLERLAR